MHNDERGHAMTTGSAEAAAALDGAIHNFVHWKAAVMPGLKGALEADPGFALAAGAVIGGVASPAWVLFVICSRTKPQQESSLADRVSV